MSRQTPPGKSRERLPTGEPAPLRIIGGSMRGRKLRYSGDVRTRPMKDRVREAIFNLVGPQIRGALAIDLFAGTGALGLEALSRGAERAVFVEQHFPTAAIIRQNIDELGQRERAQVFPANTFIWAKREPLDAARPWIVFCSPPYAFYVERQGEMLELIAGMASRAPGGSVLVVEADARFDFAALDALGAWDVREYPPAMVGIVRKSPEPT